MEMKAVQDAADFGASSFGLSNSGKLGRGGECVANVPVGETSNTVIAIHHRLEELEIGAGERVEGSGGSAGWAVLATGDTIHFSNPGGGIRHDR